MKKVKSPTNFPCMNYYGNYVHSYSLGCMRFKTNVLRKKQIQNFTFYGTFIPFFTVNWINFVIFWRECLVIVSMLCKVWYQCEVFKLASLANKIIESDQNGSLLRLFKQLEWLNHLVLD